MLRLTPSCSVYLEPGPTAMRNNIDGLALMVEKQFKLDPFSSSLFVLCNRKKDKLKILFWDKNGFWLYYRRLEEGVFDWPPQRSNGIRSSMLCQSRKPTAGQANKGLPVS